MDYYYLPIKIAVFGYPLFSDKPIYMCMLFVKNHTPVICRKIGTFCGKSDIGTRCRWPAATSSDRPLDRPLGVIQWENRFTGNHGKTWEKPMKTRDYIWFYGVIYCNSEAKTHLMMVLSTWFRKSWEKLGLRKWVFQSLTNQTWQYLQYLSWNLLRLLVTR
jgi:hypothetical protein